MVINLLILRIVVLGLVSLFVIVLWIVFICVINFFMLCVLVFEVVWYVIGLIYLIKFCLNKLFSVSSINDIV